MMTLTTLFIYNELSVELISYIDARQNILFRGKDFANILGYSNTNQALKDHVSEK